MEKEFCAICMNVLWKRKEEWIIANGYLSVLCKRINYYIGEMGCRNVLILLAIGVNLPILYT